jgi:hypothetical protein
MQTRIILAITLASLAGAALGGCSAADGEAETTGSSSQAFTFTKETAFVTFGGGASSQCVTVTNSLSLVTTDCANSSGQTFLLASAGSGAISTRTGLCLDIKDGDLRAGVLQAAFCNGTINQKWTVRGGQIVSQNVSDGHPHCLDLVSAGPGGLGFNVVVARCNGAQSQSFWPAGATLSIQSTLHDPQTGSAECLDVGHGTLGFGATVDDSDCGLFISQEFFFTTLGRIRMFNNGGIVFPLCLTHHPQGDGTQRITLEACDAADSSDERSQQWALLNRSRVSGSTLVFGSTLSQDLTQPFCLDIQGDNPAGGTPVDGFTCNGTAAQVWVPTVLP